MSKGFFRNAGWLAFAELIARSKGMILLPLLARNFGAEGFGIWSQVIMLTMIALPLVVVSSDASVIRLLPGRRADEQRAAFTAWVLWLLAMAGSAALFMLLAERFIAVVFFGNSQVYLRFIPLAAASVVIAAMSTAGRTWFRFKNAGRTVALVTIVQAALGVVAAAAAILLNQEAYHVVLYTVTGDALIAAGMLTRYTFTAGWRLPDFSFIPPVLRFGIVLLPAGYAMWGLNWADRFFVLHYFDLAALGIYAAASSFGYLVIQLFVNPLWNLYAPVSTRMYQAGDIDGLNRLCRDSTAVIFALAVPACFGLWAVGPWLLPLLGDPSFIDGVPIMPLIGLGYLCLMISAYHEVTLGFVHRQYLSGVAGGIAFAANLALNALLIPVWGIVGAALATFAAFAVQLIFSAIKAKRAVPGWVGPAMPWRVIAASLVMAAVVRLLGDRLNLPAIVNVSVLVAGGVVVYAALAIPLGIVPAAVVASLARRVPLVGWGGTR